MAAVTGAQNLQRRLLSTLAVIFRIDPRSLAAFRIAAALLLLADLVLRATDLAVMYTDGGMFPRVEMSRYFHWIWSWSIHSWGGSAAFEAVLFGIAGIFALMLAAGYQTRLAVIGSWLMLISIQHRVQPILSGAEILLRLLLFWSMFLPLGQRWSLDAWRRRRKSGGETVAGDLPVASIASMAILVQMGLSWVFSAIFKTNSQWLHGEALAPVFAHDFYASPSAAWLLNFPQFLPAMTVLVYVLEWSALLLFVPRVPRLRLLCIAGLALLHIGIGICLEVGLFAFVSLTGLILFLPPEFWNSPWLIRRKTGDKPLPPPAGKVRFEWDGPQRVCLFLFLYVLLVNVAGLRNSPVAALGVERWMPLSKGLGLAQRWGMFEEAPSKDGWVVARASLADGSEVDLLRQGAPVDWKRPAFPGSLYPNHYWQKLFREMTYTDAKGFQLFRPPVCRFLCRQWNGQQSEARRVVAFDLVFCADTGDSGADSGSGLRELLLHLGSEDIF